MISINSSNWLIPIAHFYFYIIYTWAHGSGMQIWDLAPFTTHRHIQTSSPGDHPLWTDRLTEWLTESTENINFLQLCWRVVKIGAV